MALADLFKRKSVSEITAETEGGGTHLKRSLGAFDLTMLGIGAIIGAGLFSSIKQMIAGKVVENVFWVGAGPAVSISFLITAVACGFAALCYAEIASTVPISGSAYSYSYVAFGEIIAWIIGWDLLIEYAIGNVYVAQAWGDYFNSFLDGVFHVKLPATLTADVQTPADLLAKFTTALADAKTPEAAAAAQESLSQWHATWDSVRHWTLPWLGEVYLTVNLPAAAITILLTVLLFVGVKESTRANAVMVGLKLILIAAFIGIGMFHVDSKNWTPFAPNGFAGIWHGAAIGFFAYIGFDAVSTAAEETKNPQRDLPRGMIWSLVICTILYIITAVVLTGMMPWQEMKGDDPLSEAFEYIGWKGTGSALAFGAIVAMTAVLLVFQLGQTRIFYVMARDGLLPKVFSKVHARFKTPHVNTWITGILVAVTASLITPDQAVGLTNIGTLFAFILVSIGVIALRRKNPTMHRPFKVPGYPVTPIISALACLFLIGGLEISNWLRFIVWLALGLIVYALYGYRHSALRRSSGR